MVPPRPLNAHRDHHRIMCMPPKIEWTTADKQRLLLEKLAAGWSVERACDFVGVSVKTYEYWRSGAKGHGGALNAQQFPDAAERIRAKQSGGHLSQVPDFQMFSQGDNGNSFFEHQPSWL